MTRSVIVGIDPGCTGAIVAIAQTGEFLDHIPMPTVMVGKKNRVNGTAVSAFLRKFYGCRVYAVIEQVGAMPGQGTASMFSFGHAAGVVQGVLEGMEIPYETVTPQAWKKRAGLIGTEKDAARCRAIQLYPGCRTLDLKGKGQAMADALLIARFAAGLDLETQPN